MKPQDMFLSIIQTPPLKKQQRRHGFELATIYQGPLYEEAFFLNMLLNVPAEKDF
jgi:hypothetical protein